MKPKKIKKLVLKKEIIANLSDNNMNYLWGGKDTEGTGYGPCQCNPTDFCCGTYNGPYPSCASNPCAVTPPSVTICSPPPYQCA